MKFQLTKKCCGAAVAIVCYAGVVLHALPPVERAVLQTARKAARVPHTAPSLRVLTQLQRNATFRPGVSTPLPYRVTRFPKQIHTTGSQGLLLADIQRQVKSQQYTPQFFSTVVQNLSSPEYQTLFYQNFLSLSLQGLNPSFTDTWALLNYLQREALVQLEIVKEFSPSSAENGQEFSQQLKQQLSDNLRMYHADTPVTQETLETDNATRGVVLYVKTPQQQEALKRLGVLYSVTGALRRGQRSKIFNTTLRARKTNPFGPRYDDVGGAFALGVGGCARSACDFATSTRFQFQKTTYAL